MEPFFFEDGCFLYADWFKAIVSRSVLKYAAENIPRNGRNDLISVSSDIEKSTAETMLL